MQFQFSIRAHSIYISLIVVTALPGLFACAPQSEPVKPTEEIETLPVVKESAAAGRVNAAVTALIKQADALIKQQRWPEATAVMERAIRIDSNQADSWTRMAIISLGKNNPEQTIHMAKKSNSLARNNKSLQAWNWSLMSRAYTLMQKTELARQAAQTSQQLQLEAE